MKLAGVAATRYFARPDADRTGLLIFGADAMRVALRRQEVIAALIGPEGEAEMRLTRIPAAELRKDGAALMDAMKAVGFFPGPRVAFVEDATDTLAPVIAEAVKDWREGDAQIVVTAGSLTAKSALRKIFEGHSNAYAIGIYDDPPSREEIEDTLKRAGLHHIAPEAMTDLLALAKALDPGDFRQTVEKIALYKFGDTTPLAPADVAACAPATIEAEVDDVLNIVAEGRTGELGQTMRRIEGQGVQPVQMAIAALRHFRALHFAASDPGGPGAGLQRMRPPVFGPRRDRMQRQAQAWGMFRLEEALKLLIETDLTLRSTSKAPQMAVMERALLRLAMMARR
ncbi:DNA polymerase III subunit delta [Sedimentimonas flavescens]|uniref:DNA-directed DNA polymerase n=1 Tax=Sedimentimonas flavescens TaxID=2851012 RepID=A0ABT2ZZK6_9RHOB|nr:DNA polymerase III subunit delta [Sedimentimonas flavescens]MCT2540964.1 DNA polymerase III subunit delta [Sedimentimonas flavescens]MCV2879177.1 DNA polymerase III subunit delta [Sedimentimonas flavescens]